MQLRSTIVNMRVYKKVMKEKHANFYAKTCGTFIHKKDICMYPWLHATPDFLCYCTLCHCCGEGCREVKCPYCLKDTDLKDYPDKSNSCLKSEKGASSLKREHAYYYQSQQQIFTTGYHYLCFYWTNCFVLWKNSPITVNHAVNVLERVANRQQNSTCSAILKNLLSSLSLQFSLLKLLSDKKHGNNRSFGKRKTHLFNS